MLGHFGGGIEYRITPHIGLFGKAGYDLVNPDTWQVDRDVPDVFLIQNTQNRDSAAIHLI